MGYLNDHCVFTSLRRTPKAALQHFYCGNPDLDDFFHEDFLPYEEGLMGKSYCFILPEDSVIVGAFTVCNASIHTRLLTSSAKKILNENVDEEKRNINYPAVLIGRLGINLQLHNKHFGSELMDFIKAWFIDQDNKTGCRFLLVDAYNKEDTIRYYKRNGFNFLFANLDSEKRYRHLEKIEGDLQTRIMYFDLILMKS